MLQKSETNQNLVEQLDPTLAWQNKVDVTRLVWGDEKTQIEKLETELDAEFEQTVLYGYKS